MKWMRWLARGIGLTVAGFWLLIGFLHAIGDSEPWTWESTVIALLVSASVLGVPIGWRKEAIGGIILVTVATAFGAFAWGTAGHNEGFAVLISGGPFLVIGILFRMAWWRTGIVAATVMDHHAGENGHVD